MWQFNFAAQKKNNHYLNEMSKKIQRLHCLYNTNRTILKSSSILNISCQHNLSSEEILQIPCNCDRYVDKIIHTLKIKFDGHWKSVIHREYSGIADHVQKEKDGTLIEQSQNKHKSLERKTT